MSYPQFQEHIQTTLVTLTPHHPIVTPPTTPSIPIPQGTVGTYGASAVFGFRPLITLESGLESRGAHQPWKGEKGPGNIRVENAACIKRMHAKIKLSTQLLEGC